MQRLAASEQLSLSLRVLNTPFGLGNAAKNLTSSTLTVDPEKGKSAADVLSPLNDESSRSRIIVRGTPGRAQRLATVSSRHSFVNSAKSRESPDPSANIKISGDALSENEEALSKRGVEAEEESKQRPAEQEEEKTQGTSKVAVINWPFNNGSNSGSSKYRRKSYNKSAHSKSNENNHLRSGCKKLQAQMEASKQEKPSIFEVVDDIISSLSSKQYGQSYGVSKSPDFTRRKNNMHHNGGSHQPLFESPGDG